MIPWNSDKNIGISYNDSMNLVGDDDWICFLDGDAVHTSHFFGKRIEEVINANPKYGMFTCMTNRVNCPYQIAPMVDRICNDQEYHRVFGESLWEINNTVVEDITDRNRPWISGVLIAIKKTTWKRVGGFKESKMLGVDTDMHKKIKIQGEKIGLMTRIYVQHWDRGGDKQNTSQLL